MGILQKTLNVIVRKAMLTVAIAAGKKILGKAVAPTETMPTQHTALSDTDKPSDFLTTESGQLEAAGSETPTTLDNADITSEKTSVARKPRSRSPRSKKAAPGTAAAAELPQAAQPANTSATKPKKPRAPRKKTPPVET